MSSMVKMISMSCNHEFDQDAIANIIENTFIGSKVDYDIKCPMKNCGKIWELDECASAISMSGEHYEYYLEEIEKRASPTTKACPFCGTDCEEPTILDSAGYRVNCSSCHYKSDWCWECGQKWKTNHFRYCGNSNCTLNKDYGVVSGDASFDTFDALGGDDHDDNKDIMQLDDNNNDAENIQNKMNKKRSGTKKKKKTEKNGDKNGNKNGNKNSKNDNKNSKNDNKKSKNGNKKKGKTVKTPMQNGLIGLYNLGNTCFMNSALQCLLQCPSFIELFFYDKIKLPKTTSYFTTQVDKNSLSYIWSSFIKEVYTANYGSITPRNIKNALNRLNPVIGNGSQEDAFRVIETLLEGLDEELYPNQNEIDCELQIKCHNDIPSQQKMDQIANKLWLSYIKDSNGDGNVIRQLFDGMECEKLTCCDCNYESRTFQRFRQIELPLCNKNITLQIKIYIPQINEIKSGHLTINVAFDNTMIGLKYIILPKLDNILKANNMNKDNVKIKFGYINVSNNNKNNININSWIRYLNDNDNCAKIQNYSEIFAVVYNTKMRFIPTFNLIVNEHDQYVTDIIDIMTFTNTSSSTISAKTLFIDETQAMGKKLMNYRSPIICYNNHMVNPHDTITITNNGCLLRLWIHNNFPKTTPSPSNININIDSNEHDIIQRALNKSSSTSSSTLSMENVINTLQHYYTKLTCYDLTGLIPGYNNNNIEMDEQKIENEKNNAQSVYNKLKKLSDSEKLANDWLRWRLSNIKKEYQANNINYTKPKMLDNLNECLKVYEMKETSDGNGIDCQICPECPEVASREVEIIKTPQILLIHIDREQPSFADNYTSQKRDNLIKYPINALNFKNDIYDLFGVVVHHGYGTDFGHYICYIKSLQNKKWYEMNDSSSPSKINKAQIISNNASILFYHKRSQN